MRHNVDTLDMPLGDAVSPVPAGRQPADSPSRGLPLALLIAVTMAIGGCASSGAVPRPFPGPSQDRTAPPSPAGDREAAAVAPADRAPHAVGYAVAGTALDLRGAPYRNGGDDPSGFDCSGFIRFVFGRHGIPIPRTVTEQYGSGRPVDAGELQAGDLVFFSTVAPGASHVGMSIGGDQFVHAPSSKGEVRVERFSAPYWRSRFVGARRVL